jgi:hypothetical protein
VLDPPPDVVLSSAGPELEDSPASPEAVTLVLGVVVIEVVGRVVAPVEPAVDVVPSVSPDDPSSPQPIGARSTARQGPKDARNTDMTGRDRSASTKSADHGEVTTKGWVP